MTEMTSPFFAYMYSLILSQCYYFLSLPAIECQCTPLFILYAAVGGQFLYETIRNRSRGLLLPVFFTLVVILNWPAASSNELDAQLQFDLGEVALRKEITRAQ